MALVSGPLLSMRASGQIGKSVVFSKWKGRQTARAYVIPSNPQSAAQTEVRTTFQWVHDLYKSLGADAQAAWILKAAQMQITAMNAFTGVNVPLCRASTDAHEVQFICEVNGGPTAAAPALTPGSGTISATLTAPTLPTGWTIDKAIFLCLKSVDPHGEMEAMPIVSITDASSPYSASFTGLAHTQLYVVGGAFQYARSATVKSFGVSQNTTATTT
jgi:hypothetical protein